MPDARSPGVARPRRLWATLSLLALLLLLVIGPVRAAPAAGDDADIAPGRVIVKLRQGRSAAAMRTVASSYGATAVDERPRLGGQVWQVPQGSERDVARRLTMRADVEYAEPDRIKHLEFVPSDRLYTTYQWNLPKINAPQAWDVTTGDSSVKVAVIDSGFDVSHPDRPANLQVGCDYVVWRLQQFIGACPTVGGDENGHGTHVAGIVAARQNNAIGITGVAPNVTLLAIRTADATGSSYTSDVASAIREATDAGARVINLSLGGTTATTTEYNAVNYALSHGVVVVAAAGNEYDQGNPRSYPAAFSGVVAVGSASNDDQHAYFSNTGSYVSIVAPGGSALDSSDDDVHHWITSLYPVTRGGYLLIEGTSQASPHVAGVAGLMLSVRPSLSGSDVARLLKSSARPIGSPVPNDTFGYGYLDALAAVRAAQSGGATPTPTPTPTSTLTPSATPSPTKTPAPVPTLAVGGRRMYAPIGPRGGGF